MQLEHGGDARTMSQSRAVDVISQRVAVWLHSPRILNRTGVSILPNNQTNIRVFQGGGIRTGPFLFTSGSPVCMPGSSRQSRREQTAVDAVGGEARVPTCPVWCGSVPTLISRSSVAGYTEQYSGFQAVIFCMG